jgi:hypothetical protein
MKSDNFLFAAIVFILLISANNSAYCRDLQARLSEASSVDVIIKDFERFKGVGQPEWVRFSNEGKEIIAIWDDPFSGRSAVFVQAYFYNGKKWILFLDHMIENTNTLSVLILQQESEMVFYSSDKKIVMKCSLFDLKPLHQSKGK